MSKETSIMDIFLKLSHDLKNDFVIIRAASGSIKKQLPQSELIDTKIETINQALNAAAKRLEMAYTLLKRDLNNEKF